MVTTKTTTPLDLAIQALEHIKANEGKVCEEYEICTHRSCDSSYSSWATADSTLRLIKFMREKP